MTNYHKIAETTYGRDLNSFGIIETDYRKIEEYKTKSKIFTDTKKMQNEIILMRQRLDEFESIKSDVAEIKEMLKGIVR